jgi:hypothetical protein
MSVAWLFGRKHENVNHPNSLAKVSARALTGDRLLQHIMHLIETYGEAMKEEFPVATREQFFILMEKANNIGRRYSSSYIPLSAASEIKSLLSNYLISTNEFYLQGVGTFDGDPITMSYKLMNERLDKIDENLVASDERKLGVSNFYLEDKNRYQPPVADD